MNLVWRSFACVVLPLRSRPSRTMNAPLAGAEAAGAVGAIGTLPVDSDMLGSQIRSISKGCSCIVLQTLTSSYDVSYKKLVNDYMRIEGSL